VFGLPVEVVGSAGAAGVRRRAGGWLQKMKKSVAPALSCMGWWRQKPAKRNAEAGCCGEVQKPVSIYVAREGRSGAGREQLGQRLRGCLVAEIEACG
jgi:hypothetical protein